MSECSLTKDRFLEIVKDVEVLQERQAGIAADIKEKIAACAAEYKIEKKHLNKAVKECIKYNKDKTKYLDDTKTVDQLLVNVIEY